MAIEDMEDTLEPKIPQSEEKEIKTAEEGKEGNEWSDREYKFDIEGFGPVTTTVRVYQQRVFGKDSHQIMLKSVTLSPKRPGFHMRFQKEIDRISWGAPDFSDRLSMSTKEIYSQMDDLFRQGIRPLIEENAGKTSRNHWQRGDDPEEILKYSW